MTVTKMLNSIDTGEELYRSTINHVEQTAKETETFRIKKTGERR